MSFQDIGMAWGGNDIHQKKNLPLSSICDEI